MNELLHKLKINLFFVNDLRDINTIDVMQKITINTQFSFSYIVLLSSSTVVCTLGLLLNSAPIVIGGMLISPLMWPLMKISAGVSMERKIFISQALHLLLFSILIGFLSSIIITLVSPLKIIDNEILARTQPTILDIFVAMSAGAIAAFSISQKKISDSLAGVAIATSLMPPLCVSGIGIALGSYKITFGGFLLFFTNVISIIFISVLIFTFIGLKRKSDNPFKRKGILFIATILIITSFPLLYLLQNYSFQLKAYSESKTIIESTLSKISPDIFVENIKVEDNKLFRNSVFIRADIVIPENIQLDYRKKIEIVDKLENLLDKNVDLNLRIQRTVALQSESELTRSKIKKDIAEIIETEFSKFNGSIFLSTIESVEKDGLWTISVVAHANPDIIFTENERFKIQDALQQNLAKSTTLRINLIPLLTFQNQTKEDIALINEDVESFINANFSNTNIRSLLVKESNSNNSKTAKTYNITIRLESSSPLNANLLSNLKSELERDYKAIFNLKIIRIETDNLEL